jgi:hypothetical protein
MSQGQFWRVDISRVRLGSITLLLVILATLPVCAWTHLASPRAVAGPDKWSLWQSGARLRGANIYQRRSYPDADGDQIAAIGPVIPPYTQADFDKLAAMGANYVNISHPGLFTETPPYVLDPVMQNNLDQLLAEIAQADLFAVISFRTGPGRNEFIFLDEEDPGWLGFSKDINFIWPDPNDPSQQDEQKAQAAQDGWVAMWRYTAQRYQNNPVVVGYDLMVEPNSNRLLDIWDPAGFYPAYANTLYDWNQLHPRLSAAIREVDPDTPILTGGLSYSSIYWLPYLQPTADSYTVYTVHTYEPFVYTHQDPPLDLGYPGTFDADGDGQNDTVNQTWLDNLLAPVDDFKTTYHAPVAINEFGLKRWEPGAAQYMADQMALFEQRGLNQALWLWAPADPRFTDYTHEFNPLLGPDPAHRQEVQTSALLEVIKQNWQLNVLRPGFDPDNFLFLPLIMK